MGSAAALRNRIAHGYATVDLPRLLAEILAGETSPLSLKDWDVEDHVLRILRCDSA
jgi:hypothetical protein